MIKFSFPRWWIIYEIVIFIIAMVDKFINLIIVSEKEIVSKLSQFDNDLTETCVIFLSETETSFIVRIIFIWW